MFKCGITVIIAGLALMMMTGVLGTTASGGTDQTTASDSTLPRTAWGQAPSDAVICDQGPANPPISKTHDLDEDAADWGVFCEGWPTWVITNVATPSLGGKSLQCSLTGGVITYSNVHCYRNLLPEPSASVFTLTMPFWFTPTTTCNNQSAPSVIQALEFSMNKYKHSKRYEFALQWQNVGEGAPRWRYWDPHQSEPWVPIRPTITQCLQAGQWHTLSLEGEILGGQVHYQKFIMDDQSHILNLTTSPTPTIASDGLAIAFQLDGNATQSPYDVFVDKVSFVRKPVAQLYLPLVMRVGQPLSCPIDRICIPPLP